MAQKTQVPQQKTFFYPESATAEKIDAEINKWRMEMVKKGNFPSPNAPEVTALNDGSLVYVCMFAETVEI